MLGYIVLTLAYSFSFKRVAILDVATIAALFTLRIVMGGVLNDLPLSPWLNSFSAFFFFSLALAKRNVELIRFKAIGNFFKSVFKAIVGVFKAIINSHIGRALIQIAACAAAFPPVSQQPEG